MKKILNKLNNVGSFLGTLGLIALLINQFYPIDLLWLEKTIEIIGSLLVMTGILNNPDNIDLIKFNSKF